jgi:O-antigen/teichoic acid export membrane protein
MVAIPFVPALANSIAVGDDRWSKRAIRRISKWLLIYGALCLLGLTVVGPWAFHILLGGRLEPGRLLLFAAGIYLAVVGLENFFFLILCSLNHLPAAAGLYLLRAALTAITSWIAVRIEFESGIFFGAAVSVIVVTLWSYPLIVRRAMWHSVDLATPVTTSLNDKEGNSGTSFLTANVP